MNLVWSCAALAALWGVVFLLAQVLRRWAPALNTSLCGLAALGLVSVAGFKVCALGFRPLAPLPAAEYLGPHPLLAPAFWGVGAVGLGLWVRRDARAHLRAICDILREPPGALLALALAAAWLWTLLPPFRTDERLYHLTMPLQYLLHGGFHVIEGHGNSSFPQFGEMLSFWMLACGSIAAARAVQIFVVVLGVFAVRSLLPDWPRAHVLWAMLFFVLTPVVYCIVPSSHIDVLQAFYELVAVLCLARFAQNGGVAHLFAAAWLAGCAAACKYLSLALVPFMVLAALLVVRAWRLQGRSLPGAKTWLVAGALLAAPILPWLGRNAFVWHNPLFPFLTGIFKASEGFLMPTQREVLAGFMAQFGPRDDAGRQIYGPEALWRLPYDIFVNARFDRLQYDGVIGPLALVVAALTLITRKAPRGGPEWPRILSWCGIYRLLVWLSTSWQMRFIISPYVVVCLALPWLFARLRGGRLRWFFSAAAAGCLIFDLHAIAGNMPAYDRRMLGDAEALHALRLERAPTTRPCDTLAREQASGRVPKLMLVWEQPIAFWCPFELFSESYDEAASLNQWLLEGGAAVSAAQMRARGITHLLIDENYFMAMPPGGVPPEEGERLRRIFVAYRVLVADHLQRVEQVGDTVLYAVP